MGKWLGLQNNQRGKLWSLRNPPKFPSSLLPFPLTLDNPVAQWSQDSSDRCPLLCPAVFQVSQHRARSPGQRKLSAAGMGVEKPRDQAAAEGSGPHMA